ncbi:DUF6320 domain-containing protein [Paenibacillus sp. 7541]|nr:MULTISPECIES: DUF6320 domain-containing protein [Paenibacillus]
MSDRQHKKSSENISKWLSFIVVSVISVLLIVNILSSRENMWSLYLLPCLLYIWLSIRHTIVGSAHLGRKILVQLFGLSIMLLWIDVVGGSHYWSTEYVIPFVLIAATLLVTLICCTGRSKWRGLIGCLLNLHFLSFVPLLLYLLELSQVLWTAVAAALHSLITFGGMLLLADNSFREEIKLKFHV